MSRPSAEDTGAEGVPISGLFSDWLRDVRDRRAQESPQEQQRPLWEDLLAFELSEVAYHTDPQSHYHEFRHYHSGSLIQQAL